MPIDTHRANRVADRYVAKQRRQGKECAYQVSFALYLGEPKRETHGREGHYRRQPEQADKLPTILGNQLFKNCTGPGIQTAALQRLAGKSSS